MAGVFRLVRRERECGTNGTEESRRGRRVERRRRRLSLLEDVVEPFPDLQ